MTLAFAARVQLKGGSVENQTQVLPKLLKHCAKDYDQENGHLYNSVSTTPELNC